MAGTDRAAPALAVRRGTWWWAALFGYLAGTARPIGCLLVVPAVIEVLRTWPADRLLELAPAYWQKTLQQPETQDKLAANVFRRVVLSPPS